MKTKPIIVALWATLVGLTVGACETQGAFGSGDDIEKLDHRITNMEVQLVSANSKLDLLVDRDREAYAERRVLKTQVLGISSIVSVIFSAISVVVIKVAFKEKT